MSGGLKNNRTPPSSSSPMKHTLAQLLASHFLNAAMPMRHAPDSLEPPNLVERSFQQKHLATVQTQDEHY